MFVGPRCRWHRAAALRSSVSAQRALLINGLFVDLYPRHGNASPLMRAMSPNMVYYRRSGLRWRAPLMRIAEARIVGLDYASPQDNQLVVTLEFDNGSEANRDHAVRWYEWQRSLNAWLNARIGESSLNDPDAETNVAIGGGATDDDNHRAYVVHAVACQDVRFGRQTLLRGRLDTNRLFCAPHMAAPRRHCGVAPKRANCRRQAAPSAGVVLAAAAAAIVRACRRRKRQCILVAACRVKPPKTTR